MTLPRPPRAAPLTTPAVLPGAPVRHGWTLLAVPAFSEPHRELLVEVRELKARHPDGYLKRNVTKRLAAVQKLILDDIPADPTDPRFRLGGTLGPARRHWFRAKFLQQYRLFFRFDVPTRVIIYAWLNDEGTKRAYGSRTDAYEVFRKRLEAGDPPEDWDELMRQARPAPSSAS